MLGNGVTAKMHAWRHPCLLQCYWLCTESSHSKGLHSVQFLIACSMKNCMRSKTGRWEDRNLLAESIKSNCWKHKIYLLKVYWNNQKSATKSTIHATLMEIHCCVVWWDCIHTAIIHNLGIWLLTLKFVLRGGATYQNFLLLFLLLH